MVDIEFVIIGVLMCVDVQWCVELEVQLFVGDDFWLLVVFNCELVSLYNYYVGVCSGGMLVGYVGILWLG